MSAAQTKIIVFLLIASVLFIVVPLVIMLFKKLCAIRSERLNSKSAFAKIIGFSACLVGAIWCLRYAVGVFNVAASDIGGLTYGEEIFNSIIHTLQTFSMDEDYTYYITEGKAMLYALLGKETVLAEVYGIYASVLNLAAPVAGGAIIFEILARIFPKIRLRVSYLAFWREKYYFSSLNDGSLTLAKQIFLAGRRHIFSRPVIIFADPGVEDSVELLEMAKGISAICIKDDLSDIPKNKFGKRRFFLIEENSANNLKCFANLSDRNSCQCLKDAEVFLFSKDDAYTYVENQVCNRLRDEFGFKEEEIPAVIPVKNNRNLVSNLLCEIPLYEPLIGKKIQERLNVTVLGCGELGCEMFLATYWMGQILNVQTVINVISKESEEEFWGKIDYVNPEIKKTTQKGNPLLKYNRLGDCSEPYCIVNYRSADVMSVVSTVASEENVLKDTDYLFVALGSDDVNLSVAQNMRKFLGESHLSKKDKKTVIAYIVRDNELNEALNLVSKYSSNGAENDVYMKAIGCLSEVYSASNVFMSDHKSGVQKAQEYYDSIRSRKERADVSKKRIKDDYKYWANLARAMHIKYKAFSVGVVTKSIFNCEADEYQQATTNALAEYKKIVKGEVLYGESAKAHREMLHQLSWLEHRRWCAFTRVKGFRTTEICEEYCGADRIGSYKQMELKLHPCLVECDKLGIRAQMNDKGEIDESTTLKCTDSATFDLLDELSYRLYEIGANGYDFKYYDYPMSDF